MKIEQIYTIVEDYHDNHESYGDFWPSFVNLAKKLGMTQAELFKLANSNEQLDYALEMMKTSQIFIAQNKGLTGELDTTEAISIIYRQTYAKKYGLKSYHVDLL